MASGDDEARTRNLRLAKPALSQLSYVPIRLVLPSGLTLLRFPGFWQYTRLYTRKLRNTI